MGAKSHQRWQMWFSHLGPNSSVTSMNEWFTWYSLRQERSEGSWTCGRSQHRARFNNHEIISEYLTGGSQTFSFLQKPERPCAARRRSNKTQPNSKQRARRHIETIPKNFHLKTNLRDTMESLEEALNNSQLNRGFNTWANYKQRGLTWRKTKKSRPASF